MPPNSGILERIIGPGVRRSDVFVVGFPRSGNTWLEFMLTHAFLEKRDSTRVDLNTIDDYIPNLTDLGPSDPLLLQRYAMRGSPRFFFTHSLFDSRLLRGRVIYIVRDPRDVLVSYFHFQKRLDPSFNRSMLEFLEGDMYPCSWEQHVGDWMVAPGSHPRVYPVFYEELRADTAGVLSKLLRDLGLTFTDADVSRAVEHSSFASMKRAEEARPTFRGPVSGDRMHVRKGKVGGWAESLAPEAVAVIEQRAGAAMNALGYKPAAQLRAAA